MAADHRVLILLAHPVLEKSNVNAPLAEAALGVDGVTVHDLYETYPDFCIDRQAEQERLLDHRVLVLQHPLYWYSAPALLKEWLDIVLEHGFAYGGDGSGLSGRLMMNAVSAGSTREEFEGDGGPAHVEQLLTPFASTADYCGMRYLPPFVTYATGTLGAAALRDAAGQYRALLTRLTGADVFEETHRDG